jgi:hypothetical protein
VSATCPAGHVTESTDYCDTCGLPVGADVAGTPDAASSPTSSRAGAGPASSAPATGTEGAPGSSAAAQTCPNCGTVNPSDALFCEACGYDFTTGAMPRADEPGPEAVSEGAPVQTSEGAGATAGETPTGAGAPGQPAGIPQGWVAEVWVDPGWAALQEIDDPVPSPGPPVVVPLQGSSLLVGRPSSSRNIHPDVDLSGDPGVSRRQAQLTTDGRRWWIEDLQSANGTFVAPSSAPFPSDPIEPGQRRELGDDDRIYLGAWSRLVVRRATPEEAAANG